MILFPAIDLKDGLPVRLFKGDFSTVSQVAADAVETALGFRSAGATHMHMVDLDGAKSGRPQNAEIVIAAASKSGLFTEIGGGIRDMATVEYYLNSGISRVILGSAALKDPDFVKKAAQLHGEKIAVGIDAMNRMVKTEGWCEGSTISFTELARQMEQIGVGTLIYTDISRDGTLEGPNLDELKEISECVKCNIVASGGMKTIDDLIACRNLGLYGAICGKSIYQGTIDIKTALEQLEGEVRQ